MSVCKYCGLPFSWGSVEDRWVTLVPVGEEGELLRDYQDENGVLRAGHRQICTVRGGPTVRVSKLAKPVPANEILGGTTSVPTPAEPKQEQQS